jgi:hypothetical protein
MKTFPSAFRLPPSALAGWLPDMDLNHDKQIQSLLCYRYTIGQGGASGRLESFSGQSSQQTAVPEGQTTIAHGFNRGCAFPFGQSPAGANENAHGKFPSPLRGLIHFGLDNPRLKPRATFDRPAGALN